MITVALPRLLADLIGGARDEQVDAGDVSEALDALCTRHPELHVHLFDEQQRLRPHVMCLVNGAVARDAMERPLDDGDVVTIVQAVSGG